MMLRLLQVAGSEAPYRVSQAVSVSITQMAAPPDEPGLAEPAAAGCIVTALQPLPASIGPVPLNMGPQAVQQHMAQQQVSKNAVWASCVWML